MSTDPPHGDVETLDEESARRIHNLNQQALPPVADVIAAVELRDNTRFENILRQLVHTFRQDIDSLRASFSGRLAAVEEELRQANQGILALQVLLPAATADPGENLDPEIARELFASSGPVRPFAQIQRIQADVTRLFEHCEGSPDSTQRVIAFAQLIARELEPMRGLTPDGTTNTQIATLIKQVTSPLQLAPAGVSFLRGPDGCFFELSEAIRLFEQFGPAQNPENYEPRVGINFYDPQPDNYCVIWVNLDADHTPHITFNTRPISPVFMESLPTSPDLRFVSITNMHSDTGNFSEVRFPAGIANLHYITEDSSPGHSLHLCTRLGGETPGLAYGDYVLCGHGPGGPLTVIPAPAAEAIIQQRYLRGAREQRDVQNRLDRARDLVGGVLLYETRRTATPPTSYGPQLSQDELAALTTYYDYHRRRDTHRDNRISYGNVRALLLRVSVENLHAIPNQEIRDLIRSDANHVVQVAQATQTSSPTTAVEVPDSRLEQVALSSHEAETLTRRYCRFIRDGASFDERVNAVRSLLLRVQPEDIRRSSVYPTMRDTILRDAAQLRRAPTDDNGRPYRGLIFEETHERTNQT